VRPLAMMGGLEYGKFGEREQEGRLEEEIESQ
jgi:hypothetical protein